MADLGSGMAEEESWSPRQERYPFLSLFIEGGSDFKHAGLVSPQDEDVKLLGAEPFLSPVFVH